MKAVILAAGEGKRLTSFICGKPFRNVTNKITKNKTNPQNSTLQMALIPKKIKIAPMAK